MELRRTPTPASPSRRARLTAALPISAFLLAALPAPALPAPALLPLSLLATILLSAGCDALDSERRPYTPFAVASGAATPASEPVATPDPEPAQPLPARSPEPILAPARAREWSIGGRQLQAPDGLAFRLALLGGPAQEHSNDVLAWLVGTPDHPVVGELWLYPSAGDSRRILAAPGFLPTGPACTHSADLRWTRADAVVLDVSARCNAPLLPRSAERSISVLAPWSADSEVASFQLAGPAAGERLDVQITSDDRDGDARPDIDLSVAVTSPEGHVSRARLVWFDRPAGLSRDATEPLASFRELARIERQRASGPRSSLDVTTHFAGARRLYSSLCGESGTPRVFLDSGAALDCGSLAEPLANLTEAAVDAALNLGRIEQAFAILEQHRWFPVGSAVEAERLEAKLLARVAERVNRRRVIKLVPLKARPRSSGPTPHLSPLSFHADGSLLMLTADGLVRAAPDGRYEYEASEEIDAWPTLLTSPTGERLDGVAFACDRSEVSWLRTAPNGAPLPPLATSLIAPRPGSCRGGAFTAPAIRPVAWGAGGISAFVGAALVGTPPPHPPMGSAFSPNGRYGITATPWGLFVPGGDKPALWVFEDAALPPQLRECVVSNNAQAAACLLEGRAHVVLPDPRSG